MILAILKAARATLTDRQRDALRQAAVLLDLGDPAEYVSPQGQVYCLYDDGRFTPEDAALGACLLANLTGFPDWEEGVSDVRAECVRYAEAHGLVRPADVTPQEGEDFWAAVLRENGCPPVLRIFSGIPEGWTPATN